MRLPSFRPVICSVHIAMLVAITGLMLSSENLVSAQTFPSHQERVEVDSKNIYHDGGRSQVVWEETIELPEAVWLRLYFDRLVLAHDVEGNTSSILRITSMEDGSVQTLDATAAKQWGNTSAYFNGKGVKLELIAHPNGRMNRVSVRQVDSGEVPPEEFARSICGAFDDRTLSSDPRVGRTLPGGCTAWLFNDRNNCFLTAGHCAGSTSVVQFNVPISNSNGSYNHPPPQDQYPVDQSSMQFTDGGVGNDWCYFGCFNNSNTGLSPFQAQNDSFTLVLPQVRFAWRYDSNYRVWNDQCARRSVVQWSSKNSGRTLQQFPRNDAPLSHRYNWRQLRGASYFRKRRNSNWDPHAWWLLFVRRCKPRNGSQPCRIPGGSG